ncbi:MAG: type III-B CRISPR module RAMP protein Cmr6 [Methanothrix sp.]|jgi:CRISPR-associated protein Cmr6|nr:type III-B CRISPR module RAMP protein Cmr6 [Methanothrix sp.]MDI9399184.1 type III-B CRISPR module RAMP protein Cmr6 [Euryarchaeota archaeon]
MTDAKACRRPLEKISRGEHAGLLRDRYLKCPVKAENYVNARKELYETICAAPKTSAEVYKTAFEKYLGCLPGPKAEGLFKTKGRLVIGLGGQNVLETGLTLHHTYGVPIIPGSALKGLSAHYCHNVWGRVNRSFCRDEEFYLTIFGKAEDAGHIIFHDAWITPFLLQECLKLDVMTPHHGDYYIGNDPSKAPTDFDDPNPVTFLSVVGAFHIVVSCDVPGVEGKKWADLSLQLLSEALLHWGIGGKTNVGYGRLIQDNPTNEEEAHAKPVLRHKKGEVLDVIRVEDPKGKGRIYFLADDGFGGFVRNPPQISVGENTRLEVVGVMTEGYDFAVPGSREEHLRQKKDKKGRR